MREIALGRDVAEALAEQLYGASNTTNSLGEARPSGSKPVAEGGGAAHQHRGKPPDERSRAAPFRGMA